jgi:hypothetical protein
MSPTTPGRERQAKFVKDQARKGLVLVRVWVPKGCEDKIREQAGKLIHKENYKARKHNM